MKKSLLLLLICLLAPLSQAEEARPSAIEFRLVTTNGAPDSEPIMIPGTTRDGQPTADKVPVLKKPVLDGSAVRSAKVGKDTLGKPQILIKFTDAGSKQFAEITREHVREQLAIVVDGKALSAPHILSEITGGECVITGSFSAEEAEDLAKKINAAAKK